MSARRRLLERVEGVAFDVLLVAVAVGVAEDTVQDWLLADTAALYHGLALLHTIACPALLVAIIAGYGKAGTPEELQRQRAGPLIWASVFVLCGSFVIPCVLGLLFEPPLWELMGSVFAPLGVLALWGVALVYCERRGWVAPSRVGERKPWWSVQALALLAWAYLVWLETMLLVAAEREGPLSEVGIPIGVLIDYLPIRVVLYYVRDSSRWEILTIAASVIHLLYRIHAA